MYQLPRRNLLQKKSTILNTKNSKWVSGLMHIWKTSKRISRNLERHQVYHLGKRTLHHMVYPGHKGHERSAAQPLCSNRVSARSLYPACPALQKWMLPSLWRLSPFASSRNPNISLPNTTRRCYVRELSAWTKTLMSQTCNCFLPLLSTLSASGTLSLPGHTVYRHSQYRSSPLWKRSCLGPCRLVCFFWQASLEDPSGGERMHSS